MVCTYNNGLHFAFHIDMEFNRTMVEEGRGVGAQEDTGRNTGGEKGEGSKQDSQLWQEPGEMEKGVTTFHNILT